MFKKSVFLEFYLVDEFLLIFSNQFFSDRRRNVYLLLFLNSLINADLDKQKEKQQQNIPQIREIYS